MMYLYLVADLRSRHIPRRPNQTGRLSKGFFYNSNNIMLIVNLYLYNDGPIDN